jgi:hypothetical protein
VKLLQEMKCKLVKELGSFCSHINQSLVRIERDWEFKAQQDVPYHLPQVPRTKEVICNKMDISQIFFRLLRPLKGFICLHVP